MTNLTNTGEYPATLTITTPKSGSSASLSRNTPEWFRLPKSGTVDPHFGLSRSFYYSGEIAGFWRLVRIRQRGKLRGVTLVPYDAVATFIRNQGRSQMERA